uniref:DNA-directed RNA polymerase n=1 Tax=Steinernema glaseri TaxID=37863 RepID=A0A1I7YUE8_9BILA
MVIERTLRTGLFNGNLVRSVKIKRREIWSDIVDIVMQYRTVVAMLQVVVSNKYLLKRQKEQRPYWTLGMKSHYPEATEASGLGHETNNPVWFNKRASK